MATQAKARRSRRPAGKMTVAEAGRKGGLRVKAERGLGYYEEIGRKGGLKVRALIAAGKRALAKIEREKRRAHAKKT